MGHFICHMLIVSRQHHDFHMLLTQPADGIADIPAHPVRNQHISHISPAHRGMNRSAAALHFLNLDSQSLHKPGIAGIDPHPVDDGFDPQPRAFLYIPDPGSVDPFFVGIPQG